MKVNIHDAKSQLSKLIEKALAGEDVVIAKRGHPVVRLVRYEERKVDLDRFAGSMKGKIVLHKGWDAPLAGDDLAEFEKDNLG